MTGYHVRGDKDCKACCCGKDKCDQDGCDGIVHRMVVDEDPDPEYGGWIHNYKCDKCNWTQYFHEDSPIEFEEQYGT